MGENTGTTYTLTKTFMHADTYAYICNIEKLWRQKVSWIGTQNMLGKENIGN